MVATCMLSGLPGSIPMDITTHVYAHNNYDDIVTSLTPHEVLTCRHSEE